MTTTASKSALLRTAALAFPSIGIIGRLLLLTNDLLLAASVTANSSTNTLMFTGNHNLVTGTRFKLTGTMPAPLVAGTEYFAIKINATTIKVALTLDDAIALTEVDLISTGSSINFDEQPISAIDPISVLVSKELPSNSFYSRKEIQDVGVPALIAGEATINYQITLQNLTANTITFRHYLIAYGATAAIGSVTGITAYELETASADQSTVTMNNRVIDLKLQAI
jgi:hypothetical protein